MGKGITKRSEDYSAWYNELVKKADLAENSPVRGCMVIKPHGFAVWERMQAVLDKMFKEIDIDGNGTIDYTEFVMATMNDKNIMSNEKLE